MQLTRKWINQQISDYTKLLSTLDDSPLDQKLKPIWEATLNTLTATLKVVNLEMGA